MSIERLRTAINQRIEEGKQPVLLECEVLSVDKKAETCTVKHLDSGIEYSDVQLRAYEAGKPGLGFTVFPKKGCLCTVAIVDLYSTSAMLVNCGEIESIVLKMDKLELIIDNNGAALNGGNNGGLALAKVIAEKLTELQAKHDALTNYVGSLPVPVSGAVSGPPVPANTQPFVIGSHTTEAEISNYKITH